MTGPTKDAIAHGGRLVAAIGRFGGRPQDWLDLSTGINPWPYPVPEILPQAWTRLPDADAVDAAAAAARHFYATSADTRIVIGNGSQALIQALPLCLPQAQVAVVGTTYREHERCWALAGHQVVRVQSPDVVPDSAGVVVVVNPNNPDGRTRTPECLLDLAARLAGSGGLLVVDEAFAELTPALSVAAATGRPGLCVLRSFGKFFGLAGLRLGFALCDDSLGDALEARIGPWAASGPALAVAVCALADDRWAAETRERLAMAMRSLRHDLAALGLTVAGSTDLYVLLDHPDAQKLWHDLCQSRILTRRFADEPGWLRIGLPGSGAATDRLIRALSRAAARK